VASRAANLGLDNRWKQLKREAVHLMVLKAASKLLDGPTPFEQARASGGRQGQAERTRFNSGINIMPTGRKLTERRTGSAVMNLTIVLGECARDA
jgi:hypothetical protein